MLQVCGKDSIFAANNSIYEKKMDIKAVLKKYGVTTYELAERMGIKQPSVMQYVNGNPTAKKLEDMARVIGCSPAEFFSDWQGPAGEGDAAVGGRQLTAPGQFACPNCGAAIQFTAFTRAVASKEE